MSSKLTPEDQKKVDDVTSRGVNSVERPPFRGWMLLSVIMFIMITLSLLSYWFARYHELV